MRTCTKASNEAHQAALKVVEDFKKAGGKVKEVGVIARNATGKLITRNQNNTIGCVKK
tara:strand:+ start:7247 stop:7420 length:174 start_codon:yes stop_codon:yes gene_type:complete